jgi:hypothetical protein
MGDSRTGLDVVDSQKRLQLKSDLRSRISEGSLHDRMRAINASIAEKPAESDATVACTVPTVSNRIIRDVPDERLEALKYEMLTQIENGLRRERAHQERALQLQAELDDERVRTDDLRAENAALQDALGAMYASSLCPAFGGDWRGKFILVQAGEVHRPLVRPCES